MNTYLTRFNNVDEYKSFLDSGKCREYNITVLQDGEVKYYPEYLGFRTIEDGGSTTISILKLGSPTDRNIEFSYDRTTWNPVEVGHNYSISASSSDNRCIYFRGNNPTGFSTGGDKYYYFKITGSSSKVVALGDVLTLLFGNEYWKDENKIIPNDCCFYGLFKDCTQLYLPPKFSATLLSSYCYSNAFSGCTRLIATPKLPALSTTSGCYLNMFLGCSKLVIAHDLPATTLQGSCYNQMFYNCTSLVKAPNILGEGEAGIFCFSSMFNNCTSLVHPPEELKPNIIHKRAYGWMFYNCIKLKTAPKLNINLSAVPDDSYGTSLALLKMFYNCTSLVEAPVFGIRTVNFGGTGCEFFLTLHHAYSVKWICMLFTNSQNFNGSEFISGIASSGIFVKNLLAVWDTNPYAVPASFTMIYYDIPNDKYYKSRTGDATSGYIGVDECDKYGNSI